MTADEQKAHAARLMAPELLHSIRVPHPRAILTGGQPGSGKSRIVNSVGIQFEGSGGTVVIDPDAIRPTLPYMKERIAAGILDVPDAANTDAGTIAYQMVQIAKAEGRNLIVDGTLQNTTRALALAGELRAAAYSVEFHGMAVSPELSHARTYTRREDQIANSPTGFGRGVGDEFHSQAVKGYAATVDAFQTNAAVDSMSLYYGDGAKVETKFEVGAWVPAISMKQTLEKAHLQPSIEAIKIISETWQVASDAMRARQAPADEQAKVNAFLAVAAEADRAAVQDRAMDAAVNDTERLLSKYTADDQSFGKRYVNSDLMKERFRNSLESGREGRSGPGIRSGTEQEALLEPAQTEASPSPRDVRMPPYTIAGLAELQASGSRALSAHLKMDWEAQTGLIAPPSAIGVEGGVILPAYNRDGLAGGVFCDADRKAFAIEEEYQAGLFIPWAGIDELARCETLCVAHDEREAAAIARAAGPDVGVVLARNQVVEAVEEVRFRFPSTPIIVTAHMGMDRTGQTERVVEQGCVFAGIAAGERVFDELPQEEARETLRTACDQAIGAGENTLAAQAGTIAAGASITVQAPAIEEAVERERFPLRTTPTEHIELSRSDRGRDVSRERDDGHEM